ncbi:MAG TPA: hypothetical protein VKG26_14760 [Bacteroidia bacterium]|nr:hypothetical protein [Bacteroidia bacterium]
MKQLLIKLIIPLTILSFTLFTKWWYALPVDAPDTMFIGFPLPFVCEGWHTSLSLQIFVTEFVIDFCVYFLFWFIVIFCINRFFKKIKLPKAITWLLWIPTVLILIWKTFWAANPDNIITIKRPFKIDVMETGYTFGTRSPERPNYYKYHPNPKK